MKIRSRAMRMSTTPAIDSRVIPATVRDAARVKKRSVKKERSESEESCLIILAVLKKGLKVLIGFQVKT